MLPNQRHHYPFSVLNYSYETLHEEDSMNYWVIVLRLIHIVAGVFWVGSSIITAVFIGPAVQATGEAGQKFLIHMVTKAHIDRAILGSAILTVLAGSILYLIDSGGLESAWIYSGPGWGFGIGGLFAVIGMIFGSQVGKNLGTLANIGAQIQGKPSKDQLDQIQAAQKQLRFAGPISTVALILALVCMATARYWRF
jgi:hypothetical protein